MEEYNYYDILCDSISSLRKQKEMTQEQVAGQLGISPQAISKWESKRSCPDIGLLPQIARMFDTTIDGLFGIQTESVQPQIESLAPIGIVENLPWPDDGALHVVVYQGHRLIQRFSGNERRNMLFRYDGAAINVNCAVDLVCEKDVAGKADTGKDITVMGSILQGGADAGKDIIVHGDVVQGNVDAGKDCEIGGNVGGNVSAGKDVTVSGSVGQDVFAGVMVKAKSVSGRIVSGVTSFIGKGKTQQ